MPFSRLIRTYSKNKHNIEDHSYMHFQHAVGRKMLPMSFNTGFVDRIDIFLLSYKLSAGTNLKNLFKFHNRISLRTKKFTHISIRSDKTSFNNLYIIAY